MGSHRIVVVIGTIKIRGHDRYKVCPVLSAIRLAEFDAGDFCYCISLVGRLKFSCKEVFFLHWLGSEPWIDAGTSQE